jgi:peptidase C25-like protein
LLHPIDIEDDLDEQVFGHKHILERELMSRPEGDHAFPYGVGRLPFSMLPCISMYYARLAELRDIRRSRAPNFTMIANLDSDKRARLMLAESISRTTVQELRNFQLKGSEHYGKSPSDSRIWTDALNADLLIYEGHIEQFSLIQNSGKSKDPYQGYQAPLFSRFPFVVLQACHSLKNAELLLNKGISGLVGSCSKIHSASGSAFIKAYIDAMLYGKVNTGEALRDAKNYALSLVKLKCARGHLEHDKTMRVALSFRLVGDPEVELFAGRLPSPVKKRLAASFSGRRTVEIATPPAHYPLVETEGYQLELFPGAETAGIVSRLRDDPSSVRNIQPLYYFRLPIPPGRSKDPFVFASCEKSAARNISLRDPFNRWIYLLHYPRAENINSKIKLTFEKDPPR